MSSQMDLLTVQVQQALPHLPKPSSAAEAMPSLPAPPVVTLAVMSSPARLAPTEKFSGELVDCRPFITDCEMHFELSPQAFLTDRAMVAFMISHVTGRARAWATAEWSRESSICGSLGEFKEAMRRVFDPFSSDREKARELSSIRQGADSVSDYAICFRTLATDRGWNAVRCVPQGTVGSDPGSARSIGFTSGPGLFDLLGHPHRSLAPGAAMELQPVVVSRGSPSETGSSVDISGRDFLSPPSHRSGGKGITGGEGGTHAAGTHQTISRVAPTATAGGPVLLLRAAGPPAHSLPSKRTGSPGEPHLSHQILSPCFHGSSGKTPRHHSDTGHSQ